MVGGLGCCGRELCCSSYLRSFAPVSVKMAKAQGLALNPSKISGQCGRLLCCLGYEYETYNELRKNLPKCGKKLNLPDGPADVVALNVLAQKITVADKDGRREIHIDDINKSQKNPEPVMQTKPSAPVRKAVEDPAQGNEESKTPRRPRRRGSRGSTNRNTDQQAPAGKDQATLNNKPGVTNADQKTAEPTNDDQKAARPRKRNRRRPRRRPEQGVPQDKD
jgi:Mg-chelatase subunit ChlI